MVSAKDIKDTYKRRYKMRVQGQEGLNTVVSIPRAVLDREARRRSLTVSEFLKQYVAVAQYDSFDGVFYSFEPVKSEGDGQEDQ
jgi:hypothetical protein